MYPNATSATRVQGGGVIPPFTMIRISRHEVFQSQLIVHFAHVGADGQASYRQTNDLDKNSFYFLLQWDPPLHGVNDTM